MKGKAAAVKGERVGVDSEPDPVRSERVGEHSERVAEGGEVLLVEAIREGLLRAADPSRAPRMQAYMKSEMAYLGVPVPSVRAVTRAASRRYPPASAVELGEAAAVLWREATHREHRYAATELLALPIADGVLELLPLYREMIVTGAWWDHVDGIAPRLGELLCSHPGEMRPVLLAWSTDPDRWLRRAAIIAQLGLRGRTDEDLLRRVIDANAADGDFFIRKAIGWALRDDARTEPDWVRAFVAARETALSSLSRREATKHLA